MTTPSDDERTGVVMREMLAVGEGAVPPVDPAELRRQATRGHLRRADAKVVLALVAVAAIVAALVVAGPLHPGRRSGIPAASSKRTTTTYPTTTWSTTTTGPTTTTTLPSLAAATVSLDAYVAAQSASDASAAAGSSLSVWDPSIVEHSPPVAEDGEYIAVAAFGFDSGGHTVQVLAYADDEWSLVVGLGPPVEPGAVDHPDSLDLSGDTAPIVVAYATDDQPDFLIPLAGAGCGQDPVLSDVTGQWQYLTFTGPFPTSEILGGNPQFDGNSLISDNDCQAIVPVDQRYSYTWVYDPSSESFVGTRHDGWPADPTSLGGSGS
jgi:hypothetical protein